MNYHIYGNVSDSAFDFCEKLALEKDAVNYYNWLTPNSEGDSEFDFYKVLLSESNTAALKKRSEIFKNNSFGYLAEIYMVQNWFLNRLDCLEEKSQFVKDWSVYRENDPICHSKTWYERNHVLLFDNDEYDCYLRDIPHEKIML